MLPTNQEMQRAAYFLKLWLETWCVNKMEHQNNGNIRPAYLPLTLSSLVREKPFIQDYKPAMLENYRYLLRRFGRLLETEGIAPSVLTPELTVELDGSCKRRRKPDQSSESCQGCASCT